MISDKDDFDGQVYVFAAWRLRTTPGNDTGRNAAIDANAHALNRAIAVGQAGETREAMSQLQSLRDREEMKNYLLLDCAFARIHELEGNTEEAIKSYLAALSKPVAPHERKLLERKLHALRD